MSWNRREVLQALPGVAMPAKAAAGRPNVIVIMSDQQRAGLTKATGFGLDTMPALDRLGRTGCSFERAYTTAPLCVPARVSLLTGRWPQGHGVRQNSTGAAARYEKDLFGVARAAGYRTAMCGKNHSHLKPERVDYWRPYMHLDGWMAPDAPREHREFEAWMKRLNHGTADEPAPHGVEAQFPYRIVSNAIEFIDGAGTDPFAMWVSFPEPHNPYQVPRPYFDLFPPDSVPERAVGLGGLEKKSFKWKWLRGLEERTYPGYEGRWRRTRSNYLGMLRMIDDQVGRLTAHLEKTGKAENTVVVYCADHGDYFCDYGLERKGAELPEVLTRVPMAWWGGGVKAQEKLPAFVSLADVLPTLCEAMGVEIPLGCQGRSLWPMLTGGKYPKREFESICAEVGFGGLNYGPEDAIPAQWGRGGGGPEARPTYDELNPVTQSGTMKMVRMGPWKLVFDMMGRGQIYQVERDPYELEDLWGRPEVAEVTTKLLAELLQWTLRTQDELPRGAYAPKRAERGWVKG